MIIFCDFDGTITDRDSDSELFREVVDLKGYQEQYRKREMTPRQYWNAVTSLAPPISDEQFAEFFQTFPIDETFITFAAFCKAHHIPLVIVSDGMEFYIRGIFAARGIQDLPIFANATTILDGKISVSFPYANEHCVGTSANCKCSHLLKMSPEDESIVYIGNGTSDRCPAQRSDIVFGKHRLAQFCEEQNIPYHPFKTFDDVKSQIETYLKKPREYKRSAAEKLRREMWAKE